MPYPVWTAGQRVTAAGLVAGKMEFVTNSGAAQTNTTTTMANANNLSFTVDSNARYWIMALIAYDAPTATDAKFDWSGPTGAILNRNVMSLDAGTATNIDSDGAKVRRPLSFDAVAGGPNATANAFSVYQEISDLITQTGGTLAFRFAANAAGTATLQADSFIYYQRIE
jgi:hypothetical protein